MKLDLSPFIAVLFTRRDRDRLVMALSEILAASYSTKETFSTKAESTLSFTFKTALDTFFQKNSIDTAKTKNVQTALIEAQTLITKIPVVKIKLAFEPTTKQISLFSGLISTFFDTPILLDPVYESGIIAGAVVEYNGKIGDYSLSNSLLDLT